MTRHLVLRSRGEVDGLRHAVARDRVLYEVRRDGGEPDWRPVAGREPFEWDAPLPLSGAKRFFFPPRETLLRWHDGVTGAAVPRVQPFALFGLRACDVTAIAYQDRFFATDPWYAHRRERAFLVALNCVTACPGGFCADLGAGPMARAGCDLALTPLPDGSVLVEVATDSGMEVLRAAGMDARPVDIAAKAALDAAEARARASFPARPFVSRAIARLDGGAVGDDEWRRLGPACFACTGCTSLCPTCSCFTVVDETRGESGSRSREWDSCLLEGFQREASGHHPAPRPGDRVRRFWYHKLSRDFAVDFGRPGCVGCGRCDVACPGSIGALRVLGALGSR
jgi:formate hydrogenlyase subunit 6/NADH:ubiquinone oxidoreductase subunit I